MPAGNFLVKEISSYDEHWLGCVATRPRNKGLIVQCNRLTLKRDAAMHPTFCQKFMGLGRYWPSVTLGSESDSCKLRNNDNNSNRSFGGKRLCRELPLLRGVKSGTVRHVRRAAHFDVRFWRTRPPSGHSAAWRQASAFSTPPKNSSPNTASMA